MNKIIGFLFKSLLSVSISKFGAEANRKIGFGTNQFGAFMLNGDFRLIRVGFEIFGMSFGTILAQFQIENTWKCSLKARKQAKTTHHLLIYHIQNPQRKRYYKNSI